MFDIDLSNEYYFVDLQEAYVLLIKEMLVPSKINYTRDFEIGLPLTSAKIPFNSGVWFLLIAAVWVSNKSLKFILQEFAEICDEVRSFYLGNLSANGNRSDMYRGVNNIMTDNFFVYGINHMAKIYADKSSGNVFFYRYDNNNNNNSNSKPTTIHYDTKTRIPFNSLDSQPTPD